MTREEKTIKLAEVDNWVKGEANVNHDHSKAQGFWHEGMFFIGCSALPKYFEDLNACNKLFQRIPKNLRPRYFGILCSQVSSLITLNGYYEATEAPADKRAEAIGKTLNLW